MHPAAVCKSAVCISVDAGPAVCAVPVSVCPCLCVPHSALLPWDTATATSHPSGFHCLRQETCLLLGRKVGQSFRERI